MTAVRFSQCGLLLLKCLLVDALPDLGALIIRHLAIEGQAALLIERGSDQRREIITRHATMSLLEQIRRSGDRIGQNLVGISQLKCGNSFALTGSINDARNLTGSGDDRDTRITGGDQLSHSISAAYGAGFDSKSYLRRFFNRQYRLAEPDLTKLLEVLSQNAGLESASANSLAMTNSRKNPARVTVGTTVARYMTAYGMSARNAFEIIDILQTCFAVNGPISLYLNYLIPLIIGHIQGLPSGQVATQSVETDWKLFNYTDMFGREGVEYTFDQVAQAFRNAASLNRREIYALMNKDEASYEVRAVFETSDGLNGRPAGPASVVRYPQLITSVSRFKNPNLPN